MIFYSKRTCILLSILTILVIVAAGGGLWWNLMSDRCYSGATRACIEATRTTVAGWGTAVDIYFTAQHRLPDSLTSLTVEDNEPALVASNLLFDAWGHAITYKRINTKQYEIRSAGPDGRFGTRDDIREQFGQPTAAASPPLSR